VSHRARQARRAENYITQAHIAAGESPPAFLRGHLALARGSLCQSRRSFEQADRLYREAEALFRGEPGSIPGTVDALVSRGQLALLQRDKELAIKLAHACAELALESGFVPLQARELFLKSTILAEDDVRSTISSRTCWRVSTP